MFTKSSATAIENVGKHLTTRMGWPFPTMTGGEVFGSYLMFMRGLCEKETALRVLLLFTKIWDIKFKALADGKFGYQRYTNSAWVVFDTLEEAIAGVLEVIEPTKAVTTTATTPAATTTPETKTDDKPAETGATNTVTTETGGTTIVSKVNEPAG